MYMALAHQAFARLLMMAFYGSVMIVVVMMARTLLKRAPRWICCVMWALVAFRLLCPLDLPSGLSVYNIIAADDDGVLTQCIQSLDIRTSEKILQGPDEEAIISYKTSAGLAGENVVDTFVSDAAAETELLPGGLAAHGSFALLLSDIVYAPYMPFVWAAGMISVLVHMAWCSWRLRKTVNISVPVHQGETAYDMDAGRIGRYLSRKIFICDDISEPFVMGVLKPGIYIPSGISGEKLKFAVLHEREHVIHGDNIWKMTGCIIIALYWFDPLVWIAYRLFSRDIEIACDERVTRGMSREERAGYSQTLLDYSAHGRRAAMYALGFGGSAGSDIKERVNRVINYKRPAKLVVFIAAAVCIAAAACFLTGPAERTAGGENSVIITHSFSDDIPDDVVLYADGMAENAASYYEEMSGSGAEVRRVDIDGISLISTGTASNESAAELYSISLKVCFDGMFDAEKSEVEQAAKDKNGNIWIETSDRSDLPTYILMQHNADDSYKKICALSSDDINEYDTPEMNEKYGNYYTAAAAELGTAYENGLLKTKNGSSDNKAHRYRVVDGPAVSTGMSWKQDPGMKAFRVWVSNDDDKPMTVKIHSAFGYSKRAEIPANTAAVVDINNNAHAHVTYELDFDSSDGRTNGYVAVETFDDGEYHVFKKM